MYKEWEVQIISVNTDCLKDLTEVLHNYATDGRVRLEGTDPDRFPTKDLIIFRRIEESLPSFLFQHSPR